MYIKFMARSDGTVFAAKLARAQSSARFPNNILNISRFHSSQTTPVIDPMLKVKMGLEYSILSFPVSC